MLTDHTKLGMHVQKTLSDSSIFDDFCPVLEAVEKLAVESNESNRGAVFTRNEVVDFILDLVGYDTQQPLLNYRVLEPAFGNGEFLLCIVKRLLEVASKTPKGLTYKALNPAIRAVELHRKTYEETREKVRDLLLENKVNVKTAARLLDTWLIQGDFLLQPVDGLFSHVVGNPPYIRQDNIPDALIREYRKRFSTIYDRADIYVPFIEHSLNHLTNDGLLGFICADRWMKNKYGKNLRDFVSRGFNLKTYIDMAETDAFLSEVSAYPAITVIERGLANSTRVFAKPSINSKALKLLSNELKQNSLSEKSNVVQTSNVTSGSGPWVLESFDELALAKRLESTFPSIENAGCKIKIGVATGADKAFIGRFEEMDVEPSRKLPLVTVKDILDGNIDWQGKGVINPFDENGKLVSLEHYPKLRQYLEVRKDVIVRRHVAKKNPDAWYRTIDRIYPDIAQRKKLLIPDIQNDGIIAYEDGNYYPHHNLYYIVSEEWDIKALQAVMRSGIARLFVSLYSTKMRGGYLRYQAQYLRRIHIPHWTQVPNGTRTRLMNLGETKNMQELNSIVADLYGLSKSEAQIIMGNMKNYA